MTQFNVPKGWALMPMEATPEMEQAAENYWNERRFKGFSADPRTWQGVYAAMRAAAPAAPVAQAVAITEKQVMIAYFSASGLHISGTSNWAAAFAQSLNEQIATPPAQHDAFEIARHSKRLVEQLREELAAATAERDQLRAEVDRRARNEIRLGDLYSTTEKHLIASGIENDRLREEVEALRKDAERYRWLRDECPRNWDVMYRDVEILIGEPQADDCENLDGIIDAAMAGKGGGE